MEITDLTEAELEALRFLRDFNEVDAKNLYDDWDGYFERLNRFAWLSKKGIGLTRWSAGYPGQYFLTPTGRALVEELEGEKDAV